MIILPIRHKRTVSNINSNNPDQSGSEQNVHSVHSGLPKEQDSKMEDSRKKRLERMKRYRARNKIKSGSVPKKLDVLTRDDFRILKSKGVPRSTLRRLRRTAGVDSSSSSSDSVDADDEEGSEEEEGEEEEPPPKRFRLDLFQARGHESASSSEDDAVGGSPSLPSGIAPLPQHDDAGGDVGIAGPDLDGDAGLEG